MSREFNKILVIDVDRTMPFRYAKGEKRDKQQAGRSAAMSIGQRIRERREELGLSQAELARRLG